MAQELMDRAGADGIGEAEDDVVHCAGHMASVGVHRNTLHRQLAV